MNTFVRSVVHQIVPIGQDLYEEFPNISNFIIANLARIFSNYNVIYGVSK